ncbi:MAG: hypothetical protein HRT47_04305 [Candidatus Caenarcaniphilales bacterium]|nr:hypothetical protein [Candidatus Caenarcaniphilales bacterium]
MLKKKQKHKDLAINQFRTTAHKERAMKRNFYEYRNKYLNIEEITKTTNKSFDKGQLLAMLETLYLSGEINKSQLAKKLGVNYTVVQNLFKIMEGRLFYMLKHNDIDNLKRISDHLCKYLTKCNKLIKSYQKSVDAIDKRLYDSNTGEFESVK